MYGKQNLLHAAYDQQARPAIVKLLLDAVRSATAGVLTDADDAMETPLHVAVRRHTDKYDEVSDGMPRRTSAVCRFVGCGGWADGGVGR